MKTTRLIPLFILALLGTTFSISAQKALKKADKQFSLKAYDLAVASYTKALEEDPSCTHCVFMIAESYHMMNRNIDATLWFRKLDALTDIPNDYKLSYAQTMKRMGQYDKAQNLFFEYKTVDPIIGDHYAQSCDFAKSALSNENQYDISLFRTCSKSSDFAPTFWKDKIIYSSFRKDLKRSDIQLNKSYIQNQGSQLFVSAKGLGIERNAVDFLRSDFEEDYSLSCASVAGNNQKIAYVKANFVDGFKHIVTNEMDISLYTASIGYDGKITNEKAFKFNEIGYATSFPSLNYSGNILYFSSNRPGGYGGYDLYVSYYKNGEWTFPDNLGDKVNSPGNEVTPYFDGVKLYFASDYHHGFGGFDLFESVVSNGDWAFPNNMGKGINSPEDDLYLVEDNENGIFYYTSNRLGGRGKHDIYTAVSIIEHDLAVIDFDIQEDAMVPKAVNLEDLYMGTDSDDNNVVNVSETESIPGPGSIRPEQSIGEFNQIMDDAKNVVNVDEFENFDPSVPPPAVDLTILEKDNEIKTEVAKTNANLVGAKRVAYGEVIRSSAQVYFIQLAAIFGAKADINSFSVLSNYGSLYKMYENSAVKIRLGYYLDENEAREVLRKVKNQGYGDAFITQRPLNTSNMELAISSSTTGKPESYASSSSSSKYKIKLASYEDPIHFDVNRVKDLGVIEQWSKRNWTIFILSGYKNLEEAEKARIKVLNRGFSDAVIVIDNNGILEKMSRN